MKCLSVFIFTLYSVLSNADEIESIQKISDICDGKQKVTMAVISLNNRGKEKAIKHALLASRTEIEKKLNAICIENINSSYDREKCQKEVYNHLSDSEKEQVSCVTMPQFARVGTGNSVPLLGEAPAEFKMQQLCISQTKIKNFNVICTEMYCDIFSSIDNLQVDTNLSVAALEDNGSASFKANGLSLQAKTNLLGESPQLALRANIGRDGKLQDFIQLPQEQFVETFFPPGSIKIGLNGHFDLGSLLESKIELPIEVSTNLAKANKVIKAEVEKLKASELFHYDVPKRLKEELEKISDGAYQEMLSAYQKNAPKAMQEIAKNFNDGLEGEHSLMLVKAAMEAGSMREYNQRLVKECMEDEVKTEDEKDKCDDKEDIIDRFDVFIGDPISKALNSSLRDPMQDVLKDLEFIHKNKNFSLNAENFQDAQDFREMYQKYYGYSLDLSLKIDKIKNKLAMDSTLNNTEDEVSANLKKHLDQLTKNKQKQSKDGLLFEMQEKPNEFLDVNKKISSLVESLGESPVEGAKSLLKNIKDDLKNIYSHIKDVKKPFRYGKRSDHDYKIVSAKSQQKNIDKVISDIDRNFEKIDKDIKSTSGAINLGASIEGFSSAGEELTTVLSGCSVGCNEFIPAAIDLNVHSDKANNSCDKPYEVAATINLETVNRYIATLFENGSLDSCTSSQSYKVCENAGFFSVKNKIKLEKPPFISWDENEKNFQLVIPRVIREGDVGPFEGYLLCNRDATSIKMKFKPVTHNGGKTIGIEGIEKIKAIPKFDDVKSNFCKVVVGAVAPVVGLAMVAVHGGVQGLVLQAIKGDIQSSIEAGVDIPDAWPISDIACIDGSKGHITIYGNMKE